MAGVYDGVISCGQLKAYGDFGLGTFEALDGEMVELDGKIFQVRANGVAYVAPDSLKVPFAAVTFIQYDQDEKIPLGTDYAGLQKILDKIIPTNIFAAIKIDGQFGYMKTRSVPMQVKPYPPLTEVTKNQSVFEFNQVSGTIVGFRCPPYVNGINVPGYHLHFLTKDHKAGGHVLEFQTANLTARLDYIPDFLMILPDRTSDFYKIDLSGDQKSNLQKVEK
jgi:acetolactate decarboxylase